MSEPCDFHILSLDGGGARGIYAAQVLAEIEQAYGVKIRDCFDLLAGTSAGAIIAGGAAAGVAMGDIVSLFEHQSPRIFRKGRFRFGLFNSKYPRKPLDDALRNNLPEVTLGEIPAALMITGSDISTGGVYVFKSGYLDALNQSYVRDRDTKLNDAIAASCAAPIYFNPSRVGANLLADGGLWANNPSITALAEAISKFGKEVNEIKMLSIGTGHTPNMFGNQKRWGVATGWRGPKLVTYLLDLQSQASTNMSKLILQDQYLRLDPAIENWGLDDTRHLGNLKALASRDFVGYAGELRAYLKGVAQ